MERFTKQTSEGHKAAPNVEDARQAPGCGMSALLEMLTRPWTLHILWLLSKQGPMRFGALRRNVSGISARLLTVRLRTLEEAGFVRRDAVRQGNLAEVTYSPTTRALAMEQVMHLLEQVSRMPAHAPEAPGAEREVA